jgi:hypothetical protein
VEREAHKALVAPKDGARAIQRQLDQERRKLQNLIAAIEGGSAAPSSLLKSWPQLASGRLRRVIPQVESRLRCLDHVAQRGERWRRSSAGAAE